MGKGSYSGLSLSALEYELLLKRVKDWRQSRIQMLHSMGYETKCEDGLYYYRSFSMAKQDPNFRWTLMDDLVSEDFDRGSVADQVTRIRHLQQAGYDFAVNEGEWYYKRTGTDWTHWKRIKSIDDDSED